MHTHTTLRALAAAAAAAVLVSACAAGGAGSHDTHAGHDAPSGTEDFNEADVSYVQGMVMHHEQAVEMSDIVIGTAGVDPEVVRLARGIKKAQAAEIGRMESWLEDWGRGGAGHADHGGSGSSAEHDGMLGPEDLRALEDADGARASDLFLAQMIEHHEGAVTMAEEHRREGENAAALDLSADVIHDQEAEIEEMRSMRSSA